MALSYADTDDVAARIPKDSFPGDEEDSCWGALRDANIDRQVVVLLEVLVVVMQIITQQEQEMVIHLLLVLPKVRMVEQQILQAHLVGLQVVAVVLWLMGQFQMEVKLAQEE